MVSCNADKYEIEGSANACQFLFNQGGKRWNVSFGKQFVKDYNQIRRCHRSNGQL